MVSYEVKTPGYTMTEKSYLRWWNRFRGTGFDDERTTYFNADKYVAEGVHSKYFMAADDAFTSAYYSCPIHRYIPAVYKGTAEAMYAYVFEQADPNEEDDMLVYHGCESDYLFRPNDTGDLPLATQMLKWWTNFAARHNPNNEGEDAWPAVTVDTPQVMHIVKDTWAAQPWQDTEKCEFWE
jgi:carboxylesterase type B